ncbi:MAG TPA: MFS transporter [candidate division Zixibacteria bacterium]|jgi:MFS family permease|nr:MFS transporter [candidate division Zixibacteria bacterium]
MQKDNNTGRKQNQPVGAASHNPAATWPGNTFASLRHRNFRLFWTGQMVSLVGTWMQAVAQGWLVLTLTNSAFLLGLVSAIGSMPILFLALPGGVAADRFDKRRLLMATQATAMVLALALAALTYFEIARIWHVVALAAISGSVFAFDAPSRQAFTVELVGKADLMNAIALNSAVFNAARILGPALAGVLIGFIGMAGCFFSNGVSFLAVILGLWMIRRERLPPPPRGSAWHEMRAGISYAWNQPVIRSLVMIIAVFSIFGMPYAILMPIFARDILGAGARGLGFLMTANGVGALTGALGLAAFSQTRSRGRLVMTAGVVFSLSLSAFALSRSFALSLMLLPLVGWSMVSQTATINTLLQTTVPDELRGRVMSLFTFVFMGMMPFGSLLAGAAAQRFGAPAALTAGAAVCLSATGLIFWRRRELLKL